MGGNRLGVDPAIILAAFGIFWVAEQLFDQVYYKIEALLAKYFTSEISVSEGDEIFDHIINWLATQPGLRNALSLRIRTYYSDLAKEHELIELDSTAIGPDGSGIQFNFSNERRKYPPQFTPSYGVHRFWHKCRLFGLQRKRESVVGGDTQRNSGEIVLSCYGRSTEPIKQLFEQAKQEYYTCRTNRTTVHRPVASRNSSHSAYWTRIANRHARPMNTVVLDAKQKMDILSDMNEYLSPNAAAWYARRGIPLRRGYLFHGPPGTGKTSLSFALAGVFGLDIYVMSLLDPSLTEQDVMSLFSYLPTRCIVLLEDIDTAGVARSPDANEEEHPAMEPVNEAPKKAKKTKKGEEDDNEKDVQESDDKANEDSEKKEEDDVKKSDAKKNSQSKENKSTNPDDNQNLDSPISDSHSDSDWDSDDEPVGNLTFPHLAEKLGISYQPSPRHRSEGNHPRGISLSGLLNAIDGVASHEGRVLVMTTNKPEALDDALIRPGRVDLQVRFTNATRHQAKELFVRMYVDDAPKPVVVKQKDVAIHAESSAAVEKPTAPPLLTASADEPPIATPDELERVAAEFAAKIPDGRLISPAEIQGYLLKRKKTPRRAAAEVDVWVKGLLEQKAKRTKVLAVQ